MHLMNFFLRDTTICLSLLLISSLSYAEETKSTINAQDLLKKTLEDTSRLEAIIDKEQALYASQPRRHFVSAKEREYRFAAYLETWSKEIEEIGTLNYPKEAKEQKLYGKLLMAVSIRGDGSIESIEIIKSSGYEILDNSAKHIVELGAPYAPFPPEISKDTDILTITRTWSFTHEDSLDGN